MLEAAVYTDLAPQLIASPKLGRTGILLEAPVTGFGSWIPGERNGEDAKSHLGPIRNCGSRWVKTSAKGNRLWLPALGYRLFCAP
jgi:hypothetical protein